MHEIIQNYLHSIYDAFEGNVKRSFPSNSDEIYGELNYYSMVKLFKHMIPKTDDHFLDIGSGFGKLVLQAFLTTHFASVTGIEINQERHKIAVDARVKIEQQLPYLFNLDKKLNLINGDFINYDFDHVTFVYVASTMFSEKLLLELGHKIKSLAIVQRVASLRKLPNLNFKLIKKIYLHASWDRVPVYLYVRD